AWTDSKQPADGESAQPACTGGGNSKHVGAINLVDVKILPHLDHVADGQMKIPAAHGERDRVDRSRRGSAEYRKWIAFGFGEKFVDRLQHADLVSRTRTPAG